MKISVIGAGYVGLCTGLGFAKKGHSVIFHDVSRDVVERINRMEPAFYEPMVEDALKEAVAKRLAEASEDLDYAVSNSEITFICVPTPPKSDGSIDVAYIREASAALGKALSKKKGYHLVVMKSTVLPETTERIALPALEKNSNKVCGRDFGLCMNPEFLREGSALEDFLRPDRIVIGSFDQRSGDFLEGFYKGFGCPILRTSIKTAEMIKYVSNAFLATKISFSNEIGNACKKMGIDVYDVMKGVGMDKRISPHFLNAGIGFGGSCFPKDVSALISKSRDVDAQPLIMESVMEINREQPFKLIELLKKKGPIRGKSVSVLGLAFKADTDDIREAPSLRIVERLMQEGCEVRVYDPKAMGKFREKFPQISYFHSSRDCLKGSDVCIILTEWSEFRDLGENDFNLMRNKVIIEGRKVLNPSKVRGFEGICW